MSVLSPDCSRVVEAVVRCTGPGGHVIWDWNGTLLDDVEHSIAVMNRLLDAHALPRLDRERHAALFDFPVRHYYDALGFDFALTSFESLCASYAEQFHAGVFQVPLFAHMEAAVRALDALGFEQSILSATDQGNLDATIEAFGLRALFSRVCGTADRLATSKVDAGLALLEASPVGPEQTVLVGDTLHDLEVANALRTHLILVDHGHHSRARLSTARLSHATGRLQLCW